MMAPIVLLVHLGQALVLIQVPPQEVGHLLMAVPQTPPTLMIMMRR